MLRPELQVDSACGMKLGGLNKGLAQLFETSDLATARFQRFADQQKGRTDDINEWVACLF